jgi:hypothetical protein
VESTAPAYEVDNFQTIAFRQVGSLPSLSGNDAAVQFHGDAIRFHIQLVDKTGESEGRSEIARFAIDLQLHIVWILAARRKTVELCSTQPGVAVPRGLRFYFAQVEFAGCGAAGVVGLDKHGRIRE